MNRTSFLNLSGVILLIFIPISIFSQSEFQVNSVLRPRAEYRDGYKSLKNTGDKPAAFVSQRARLRFDFQNKLIQTRFTLFDYRVWGDQVWKKDIASVGIHEVWAIIKLNENLNLKLGRQSIQYDNGRLISAVNWNQIGAAHDALKFGYKKNDFTIDIIGSWNQSSENNSGIDYLYDGETAALYYKNLNLLWLSKKFSNTQIASLTIIDGYEHVEYKDTIVISNPDKMEYRFTSGLIVKHSFKDFNVAARGFYQGGQLYTGQKVSAYYYSFEADVSPLRKLKVKLGLEVMSGNNYSDSTNNTSNAFNILYGARHKFNGRMDYFSVPSTTKGAGLINPYAIIDYSFNKSSKISLEYHLFYLQQKYLPDDPQKSVNRFLGSEIDLTLSKKIYDFMHLSAGYSVFFGTDSMELIKGGNKNEFNNWAFVMLTINPTLYASKK